MASDIETRVPYSRVSQMPLEHLTSWELFILGNVDVSAKMSLKLLLLLQCVPVRIVNDNVSSSSCHSSASISSSSFCCFVSFIEYHVLSTEVYEYGSTGVMLH